MKSALFVLLTLVFLCTSLSAQPVPVFGFQNGFSPRRGEFFLHNGNIVNNHLHVGLSDHLGAGIGIVTHHLEGVGMSLSLKARLYEQKKLHWSAGAYASRAWNGGYEPQQYWMAYTALYFGNRLRYTGFSAGMSGNTFWGYYSGGGGILYPFRTLLHPYDDLEDIGIELADIRAPFLGFHFRRGNAKPLAFQAEIYFMPGAQGGSLFMISPALQWWRSPYRKIDLSFSYVYASKDYSYSTTLLDLNLQFALGKRTRAMWAQDRQGL